MDTAKRVVLTELVPRVEAGCTVRFNCPKCAASEKSLSLTVSEDGSSVWLCHRAKCGFKGASRSYSTLTPPRKKKFEPSFFSGATMQASFLTVGYGAREALARAFGSEHIEEACERFSIRVSVDYPTELVFKCYGANGEVLGVQTKQWCADGSKKVRTYKSHPGPLYAFYGIGHEGPLWLVEDCLSAARIAYFRRPAIALLGTHVSDDLASELRLWWQDKPVILALDADASLKAIGLRQRLDQRYGLNISVELLERDVKDMHEYNVRRMLGVA